MSSRKDLELALQELSESIITMLTTPRVSSDEDLRADLESEISSAVSRVADHIEWMIEFKVDKAIRDHYFEDHNLW